MSSALSKRTQIYLSRESFCALEHVARARRTSVAALVREALDRFLAQEVADGATDTDPIWAILGAAEGHQTDGAARLDHYLYGSPSPARSRTRRKGLRR